MTDSNKGITLLPIVIAIAVSIMLIAVIVNWTVTQHAKESKASRLEATRLSDLGFQTALSSVDAVENLALETFVSLDTVKTAEGWYCVNVRKKVFNDSMTVLLESVGGVGVEVVKQQKTFQLVKRSDSSGFTWAGSPQ